MAFTSAAHCTFTIGWMVKLLVCFSFTIPLRYHGPYHCKRSRRREDITDKRRV